MVDRAGPVVWNLCEKKLQRAIRPSLFKASSLQSVSFLKACSLRCRLFFRMLLSHICCARVRIFSFTRIRYETAWQVVTFLPYQNLLHCNRYCIKNAKGGTCTQAICKKALPSFRKNKALSPYEIGVEQQAQSACQHGRATAAACCTMARTPQCWAVVSNSWRTRSCAALQRWGSWVFKCGW